MLTNAQYNPDVLTCLANLSSDEVFTPPKLANEMLDKLPSNLWSNPEAKFLDPCCKSGIFLREIAKRLLTGLEDKIPDHQKRINHIFKNQLYGMAITELTALISRRSLYCSKIANSKYSVCDDFEDVAGNIRYFSTEHTWKNGKCIYCGASKENYKRDESLESHAYEFIHTDKPEEIFNMKFDVIIGNPPYQLSDGGHGKSASPIYQLFVAQAKKMKPNYLSMIIPARWYAGGKGLNQFRSDMLGDKSIKKLVDFESSTSVFPGVVVAGGICYFLWDRKHEGACEIENEYNGKRLTLTRHLNEFSTFIRNSHAIPIIRKVINSVSVGGRFLNEVVSSRNPFNLATNYSPQRKGIPCWFIQKIGRQYAKTMDVNDKFGLLKKWKLLIPKSPLTGGADFSKPQWFYYEGNVRVAKPGECCTDSWLVACSFETEKEVLSFKSYLFTKLFGFLLLQTVVSQDVSREKFSFVPDLVNYDIEYTDEILRERWAITDAEWEYIDSRISQK
jgi:site-specific DNA-methyltransferase (adenine-specific)